MIELSEDKRREIQEHIDDNPMVIDIDDVTESMAEEYLDDECEFTSMVYEGYMDTMDLAAGYALGEMAELFLEDMDKEEAMDLLRNEGLFPDVSMSFESVLNHSVKRHVVLFSNYDCMNSNWLENQQGYDWENESYFTDLVDFLQLDPGSLWDAMNGRFNIPDAPWKLLFNRDPMVDMDSFINELSNSCGAANLFIIPVELEARQLALGEPKTIRIYKGTRCGLFDAYTGSGSLLECEFIRTVDIALGQYGETEYDCVELHKPSGYTPEAVYGTNDMYCEADVVEWRKKNG